jgi:hypothetical protein
MVGQRTQEEVILVQVLHQQAGCVQVRHEVALQDATDEEVSQQICGCRPDEQVQGLVEGRPEPRRRRQPVLQELAGSRLVECLGEQVMEVVHDHAPITELSDEGVMLCAGPVGPHDIVEEQVIDVVRCQPGQLQTRSMHDHLAELPDFGVDVERHGVVALCD